MLRIRLPRPADMTRRPTLARSAGILCGNPYFHRFLAERFPVEWKDFSDLEDVDRAAGVVRTVCEIQSRRELDTDPAAARRFHSRLGFPFNAWQPQQLELERQ